MEPFDNSTIVEPVAGKPHIVLINGHWRCSTWKRCREPLFFRAFEYIARLNRQLHNRED